MRGSFVIFLLIWGTATTLIYKHWKIEQQELLDENNLLLETTYRASIEKYRVATEILFEDVIQRPEVIDTFAEGIAGPPEKVHLVRGKLFRLLSPAYAHLKQKGIQELQFHTADGLSFLRFHAPDRYGDPLFDIRPSVLLTNVQKRPTFSFEIDRLFSGFKYVFPLFKGKQHLGSVEASVSFRSISEAMANIDPGHEYLLIMRKDAVNRALFPEQRSLYTTSPVHHSFLIEDEKLNLPVSPPPLSETVRMLNEQLKEDSQVFSSLSSGQPASVQVTTGDGDWAVAFVPIKDLFGENVAYVISYSKAPFLTDLRRQMLLTIIFTTLAFAGLFYLTLQLVKSHAALSKEKAQLQIITDTIADGICVMDPKGRILQVNPAFTEILGYPEQEIIDRIGHDIFHVHQGGEDFPSEKCPIIAAIKTGSSYSGEELFRHKDGRLLTVEFACRPLAKESLFEGSVGVFRDVTEGKSIQERLTESSRRMEEALLEAKFERDKSLSVLENMADGISIQNPGLRILYQNAAHRQRMGDHLGELCYQAYQQRDDICPGCHLMQSFADGKVHIRETTASPKGDLQYFQIVSTPLYDSSGKLLGGIESVRDITARVKAEEDLQAKGRELEEANRELEAFSYTLSHDLRSYLSRISLSGETLLELDEKKLSEDGKYLMGSILGTCQNMDDLIATMLTLAHISQQELQLENVDLSAMATKICGEFAKAEPERSFRFDIAPDIRVHGDIHLLYVVMENLLGNACKYTQKESETRISVSSAEREGKPVIAIADNGTGFDMAEAEKLFRPFQRLSSSRSFPGFGIGLTTVERIIHRHGGQIWAEATPGKGATFYFTLPG